MGYIRANKPQSKIFIKALVDSGNLFGEIVSEKLANLLNLKYKPCTVRAGTAVSGQQVQILGKAEPMDLILEGLPEAVQIAPYVIRNLSHDLNLGEQFLRKNKAEIKFEGTKVTLKLNNTKLDLVHRSIPLVRNSTDSRFIKIMQDDKMKREKMSQKNSKKKQVMEINQVGFTVETKNKRIIPKNTAVQIEVKTNLRAETGFFQSKENSYFLNSNSLLPLNGIFKTNHNTFLVTVLNMGDKDVVLPKNVRIGKIYPASQTQISNIVASESVNTLDHRPEQELSDKDLEERRQFLRKELNTEKMEVEEQIKEQIVDIFLKHWHAVSVSSEDFGKSDLLQFHITLVPGATPVHAKCRPLNPFQEKDLERQLKEWTQGDIIEPSVSPWASALVPCKKKGTDKLRWAVDYRAVNRLTQKDMFPLPSIETNLHKLAGASIFSSLDSAGAFHSLSIHPASRDYTTFTTPFGTYRYKRMAFGLSNSPSVYCRLVQQALSRLPPNFAIAYLDDILIYSNSIKDHLTHVEMVLKVHADCGMKLNLAKCSLIQTKVNYLGHLVSKDGVEMVPEYVEKIKNWPIPTTGKELVSFLGFTSYYRGFIPRYADTVAALNKYRNEKDIVLTTEEKEKIQELKRLFLTQPIRAYPDYNSKEPFILDTDFSGIAAGGILAQVQEGKERFIACFSKSLDAAQQKYPAHKGELLAVILGLRKFEHILRARKFVIRTDSSSITFLQGLKEARGMWARWLVYLSSFDFEIIHRPGKQNLAADALSRTIIPGTDDDNEPMDNYLPYPELDDVYNMETEQNSTNYLDTDNTEMLTRIMGIAIPTEEWILETNKDYPLQKVIEAVKKGKAPTMEERKNLPSDTNLYFRWYPLLYVKNELLYLKKTNGDGGYSNPRICVPRGLQKTVMQRAHLGHRGINETMEKLSVRAYFPNMQEKITIMINNCVSCFQKFNQLPSTKGIQQHRELLGYPMQRIYLDTVGPLTPSKYEGRTCKHILTMLDGFTRYFIAVPIPDLESKTILRAMIDHLLLIHGFPEYIHTDNGSSLVSTNFQETCKQLNIKTTRTPPYTPQGNRVERTHKTLGQLLRTDDTSNPHSWIAKLPTAVFEINVARNPTTGVTPYYALYGRNARLPLDVVFPDEHLQKHENWTKYVSELSSKFEDLHLRMQDHERLKIPFANQRKSLRTEPELRTGDVVFYFSPKGVLNLSRKLTLRWTGPYRIVNTPSEALSIIYPLGTWAVNKREIHSLNSRLKKVDPQFNPIMQEQVDLDLLQYGESEDTEVSIQSPEAEPSHTEEEPHSNGGQTVELSSDEEGEIWTDFEAPQRGHEPREEVATTPPVAVSSDTNQNLDPPTPMPSGREDSNLQARPEMRKDSPVIIKTEPEEESPLLRKRGYNRRPPPPARDPRPQRSAFQSASEKLAASYKRRK